jgi:hypothetical protein
MLMQEMLLVKEFGSYEKLLPTDSKDRSKMDQTKYSIFLQPEIFFQLSSLGQAVEQKPFFLQFTIRELFANSQRSKLDCSVNIATIP